jgi:hypothetical protein
MTKAYPVREIIRWYNVAAALDPALVWTSEIEPYGICIMSPVMYKSHRVLKPTGLVQKKIGRLYIGVYQGVEI